MILRYIIKSAIFAGTVYYTKEIGVWKDSKHTENLVYYISRSDLFRNLPPLPFHIPNLLPSDEEERKQMRQFYNHAVKSTFKFLAHAPECASELIKKGEDFFKNQTSK